jgi:tRNA modification GTPase
VSGPKSFSLFRRLFAAKRPLDELPPRFAVLGQVVDPRDGSEIDEAIATCFPSPNSYTGEDLTEFSLHGSPVLVSALLDCLCAAGARLAEPGEFTMRAFLHGRMDLTQAEAVRDIVDAATLHQARVASRQRAGEIARRLQPAKKLLIDVIADLESAVEFAEEDVQVAPRELLAQRLEQVLQDLKKWIESFRQGRIVRDGFSMAIVGLPNVGKSSVFNALLDQDRSIVTEIPGTTRDLVSEFTNINGIPVRLLDTAGIRNAGDSVEKLGVDRSLRAIAEADAILLIVDTSRPPSAEDLDLKRQLKGFPWVAVMNKMDLPLCWSADERNKYAERQPLVEVSAKTGSGIDRLRSVILNGVLGDSGVPQDGILITNLRHCRCLEGAEGDLKRGVSALRQGISEEFVLIDLHEGLKKLGEITGETSVDNLLTEIFSRFCIGK